MLLTEAKSQILLKNIFGYGSVPSDPYDDANKITIGKAGNCWLGVFTSDPVASGDYIEPSPLKNYARVNIWDLMSTSFGSSTGQVPIVPDYTYPTTVGNRKIGNYKDINFNCAYLIDDVTAQTGGEWGQIKGFGLFDSETAAAPYAWGTLLEPVTVGHKNTLHFLKGRFVVYMDDAGNATAVASANSD